MLLPMIFTVMLVIPTVQQYSVQNRRLLQLLVSCFSGIAADIFCMIVTHSSGMYYYWYQHCFHIPHTLHFYYKVLIS
jgi:hypothetical protein